MKEQDQVDTVPISPAAHYLVKTYGNPMQVLRLENDGVWLGPIGSKYDDKEFLWNGYLPYAAANFIVKGSNTDLLRNS